MKFLNLLSILSIAALATFLIAATSPATTGPSVNNPATTSPSVNSLNNPTATYNQSPTNNAWPSHTSTSGNSVSDPNSTTSGTESNVPGGTLPYTNPSVVRPPVLNNGFSTADMQLNQRVQEGLGRNISVTSRRGTVTLQGNVTSQDEADRILDQTRTLPGVTDVVNRLQVVPSTNQ